jgi:rubrerythrin
MSRFVKNKAETEELLNENFNEPDEIPPQECIWCGRLFEAEDLVDWICPDCQKSNEEFKGE